MVHHHRVHLSCELGLQVYRMVSKPSLSHELLWREIILRVGN
jgi:hypothetical protein